MTTPSFQPCRRSRPGTSRRKQCRHFGSSDASRELADPVVALRDFLRANCGMFAGMGTVSARRIDSLHQLASRLIDAGHVKPEWTHDQVVDALGVLTNVETFESLNRRRGRSWQQIADLLFDLSAVFRTH
jgi:hypothetical protein